jgi:hypothetical protein
MSQTPYIGKRLELVSMDPHFHDISIALYQQEQNGRLAFLVHSYSRKEGAGERIASLVSTMKILGGLESEDDGLLYFPCGDAHEQAIKRIFLESCKADPATRVSAQPLHIHDRKTGCEIKASYGGDGMYQLSSEDTEQNCERRVMAVTRGLLKLAQMDEVEESHDKVAFSCGQSHDALIGLLLIRAPNVRAAIREAEMMASRGVLAAPASQG